MVEQSTEDYGLTTEDVNAAFTAYPEAAQAAKINLLQRVLLAREEEIQKLTKEIEALKPKDASKA
tara:strand:- start:280 stop:474 length:195 start_codon:yes stop_codon:yes gene_type:complete